MNNVLVFAWLHHLVGPTTHYDGTTDLGATDIVALHVSQNQRHETMLT